MAAPKTADSFGTFLASLPSAKAGDAAPRNTLSVFVAHGDADNLNPEVLRSLRAHLVATVSHHASARPQGALRSVMTALLAQKGPMPVSQVQQVTSLERNAFSSCLDLLKRNELVAIEANQVSLTEKARDLANIVAEVLELDNAGAPVEAAR